MNSWSFDWQYWWYDQIPIRFGWAGTEFAHTFWTCRMAVWIAIGFGIVVAMTFAAWGLQQWKGPITLIDE